MTTTTFKGARYITKFANPIEWDATRAYEAIESVQHEGFTYISKQPVPVGVQIDNTDFWLLWADPNAQMEQLRQLVSGYVDQVEGLSDAIDNIEDSLPVSAFSAESTVDSAITQRGSWENANVLFITDSWGTEGSYGVTENWLHMACDAMGANYISLAQGSTGYLAAPTFKTRLENWVATNETTVDKINFIVACGSINDSSLIDGYNFRSALINFCNYCKTTFPKATVIIIPPFANFNMSLGSVSSDTYNMWQKVIFEHYATFLNFAVATNNKLPQVVFMDKMIYTLCGVNSNFFNNDFIHPVQKAHNILALTFLQHLHGNGNSSAIVPTMGGAVSNCKFGYSKADAVSFSNSDSFHMEIVNNTLNFFAKVNIPQQDTNGNMRIYIPFIIPINTTSRYANATYTIHSTSGFNFGYAMFGVDGIGTGNTSTNYAYIELRPYNASWNTEAHDVIICASNIPLTFAITQ